MKRILCQKSMKNLLIHAKLWITIEKYASIYEIGTESGDYRVLMIRDSEITQSLSSDYNEALKKLEGIDGVVIDKDYKFYIAYIDGKKYKVKLPFYNFDEKIIK